MALTIRTNPEYDEHLECLREALNINTAAGVIKYVVENYLIIDSKLLSTQDKLMDSQDKLKNVIAMHKKKINTDAEYISFFKDL